MTTGAAGSRGDDGLLLRNPRNADIQETPYDNSKKEKEGDDHISNVPQENGCLKEGRWLRVGWLTGIAGSPFAGESGRR